MALSVVQTSMEILGGTPVFRGTRISIRALLDYLEAGDSVSAFLEDFPTVSRGQVVQFLEEAAEREIAAATA